jgi:hypothetical protein
MHQGNVRAVSEAQTLQRIRDLVKLALHADQRTRLLLMRDVQALIHKVLSADLPPSTSD